MLLARGDLPAPFFWGRGLWGLISKGRAFKAAGNPSLRGPKPLFCVRRCGVLVRLCLYDDDLTLIARDIRIATVEDVAGRGSRATIRFYVEFAGGARVDVYLLAGFLFAAVAKDFLTNG